MTDRPSASERAHLLTTELLSPLDSAVAADRTGVLEAAQNLPRTLADLAAPRPRGTSLRITDHQVRTALTPAGAGSGVGPFAWSTRTARRALGLQAVRSAVQGEARSPIDGVRAAIAEAIGGEGHSSSPMGRWLTGLAQAGLAVVEADAVTWATRLWCALDWTAFEEPVTIGRDRWWDSPHSSFLALRGRAEVRSVIHDDDSNPFSTHLVVLGGARRSTIRSELSVVALVEALRAHPTLPPGRIVGWWPDSGHLVRVDVDRTTLTAGVAAVAHTMSRMDPSAAPLAGVAKAAA